MAASILNNLRSCKKLQFQHLRVFCRTYLSDGYGCNSLWKERLESKFLKSVDPKILGIKILDKFEHQKQMSLLDVDMYTCQVNAISSQDEYITKEILARFRHSNISCPINECIIHSVVRGYIETGQTDQLLHMMKDKFMYGIFPDDQAMCMLLSHLLDDKKYPGAANAAYEVMLQEDFTHPIKNLLSLVAAVKHFTHTMTFDRYEPPAVDPDEEMQYIPVKILRNPYYDDHFDLKSERFLLGKTLYLLGKHTEGLESVLSRSLQLIGLGLYEKFEMANELLSSWIKDKDNKIVVFSHVLDCYTEYLDEAPTRDENAEPVPVGQKSLDDEIELLKLTSEEKSTCLSVFASLKEALLQDRTVDKDLEDSMEEQMWSKQILEYEKQDINILENNYKKWMRERDQTLEKHIKEEKREQVMNRVQAKLEALQEREELLSYFENIKDINYYQQYKEKVVKTAESEEEYAEAPGERNVKKMKKGKR